MLLVGLWVCSCFWHLSGYWSGDKVWWVSCDWGVVTFSVFANPWSQGQTFTSESSVHVHATSHREQRQTFNGVGIDYDSLRRDHYGFRLPRVFFGDPGRVSLLTPIWLLLIPPGGLTTAIWLRDRRMTPGACRRCGYDLTGNVSGVCPECGAAVDG